MVCGVGIIIVSQDERTITYHHKCERCGTVTAFTARCGRLGEGEAYESAFLCSACRHRQEVRIYG